MSIRESMRWWASLSDEERERMTREAFKGIAEFEATHEATDAHLYGRCRCPRDTETTEP